jgi:hypothetical protein
MIARSELELGPNRPGLERVQRMGMQILSRGAQALAQAVGWGGFTSG